MRRGKARARGRARRGPPRRRRFVRPLLVVVLLALVGLGIVAARPGADKGTHQRVQTDNPVLTPRPAQAAPHPKPVYARRMISPSQRIHPRFKKPPRAGLLWDLDSGRVLWQRRPDKRLRIASLTKEMTAILVNDHAGSQERVRITKQALAYQGSGVGVLPKHKRVELETLLYGLLLPSGNDAAIALAQHINGTVPSFVDRMNRATVSMGLTCTHFSSPSGFTDAGNFSCAHDLATLTRALLRRPRLARIVRTRDVARPFPIKGGKLYLYNNNPLLRMQYAGTIGVKTGYTDASGRCLVVAVKRGRRRLGVVLLHSYDPQAQARRLFDLAFKTPG
jgi:D-alanyl-D-alanine carboxypeptidase (penicillin-binding protein 5/6)